MQARMTRHTPIGDPRVRLALPPPGHALHAAHSTPGTRVASRARTIRPSVLNCVPVDVPSASAAASALRRVAAICAARDGAHHCGAPTARRSRRGAHAAAPAIPLTAGASTLHCPERQSTVYSHRR
mmetsp:Transcript_53804/g.148320  ORF Transcript_53804/g.148320 Transcript_53804/m.148320 type:complete len:126 (-) Transcript_53804:126-503(-)